jgi:hypothetical protein
MSDARSQWGIARTHGEWEETRIGRSRQPVPGSVPDNTSATETLLYGPRGETLLQRVPRPVGFRDPRR